MLRQIEGVLFALLLIPLVIVLIPLALLLSAWNIAYPMVATRISDIMRGR